MSDSHSHHKSLYIAPGDFICHSGDISGSGNIFEYLSFIEWFSSLNFKHKIFIGGNHDRLLAERDPEVMQAIKDSGVHYLENEAISLEGINFYGSPLTPRFGRWDFMKKREDLKEDWDNIPENTNVLLTHGPPFGVGDVCNSREVVGCKHLLDKVLTLPKLSFHSFGHVHEGRGLYYLRELGLKTTFVNSSIMNASFVPCHSPYTFYINGK